MTPNHQPGESDRDWTEHFEHENGKYVCKCYKCKEMFYGHKRTVICKICYNLIVEATKRNYPSKFQEFKPIELKNLKNPE